MPSKTKQLVESSLMLGTALVLLFLTKYTLLGAVAVFLVPLPFLLLAMSMTASSMVWICLAFGFLGWIVTDPFFAIYALLLAIMGAVMGMAYRRRGTALPAIASGAGIVFLSIVFMLAFMVYGLHIDFGALMKQAAQFKPSFMSQEQYDEAVAVAKMGLPSSFVMASFMFSFVVHGLARLIGKRLRKPVPALKPIREWTFPRSLLYYYFIAMISLLVFSGSIEGTFWKSAILNVKIMLDAVFTLQGLSFCLFAAYLYGWKRLTPVLVVCLFIFQPLATILCLVGIFDLGIRLRDKLESRVKRG